MMKNPRSEEEKIIKDIRNLFRLEKKTTLQLKIKEIFFRLRNKLKELKI